MTDPTPSQISIDSSAIRSLPIQQRIDWLMDHAHRYAVVYQSPESFLARDLYNAKHNTALLALKCMDGRLNLPVATNTPSGIIQPFRNLGGRFDLGWPHFGEVITGQVQVPPLSRKRSMVLTSAGSNDVCGPAMINTEQRDKSILDWISETFLTT